VLALVNYFLKSQVKQFGLAMKIRIQKLTIHSFWIDQRTNFVPGEIATDEFNLYSDPLTPTVFSPIFVLRNPHGLLFAYSLTSFPLIID